MDDLCLSDLCYFSVVLVDLKRESGRKLFCVCICVCACVCASIRSCGLLYISFCVHHNNKSKIQIKYMAVFRDCGNKSGF